MVAAPVIGHSAGKSLWTSSYYYSVLTEKLYNDHGLAFYQIFSMKKVIVAKGSSNYGSSVSLSSRNTQSVKALKEHVENVLIVDTRLKTLDHLDEQSLDLDETMEELLLLQKSMLEKQWNLSYEWMELSDTAVTKSYEKIPVTCSGVSARQRRIDSKRKTLNQCKSSMQSNKFKLLTSVDSSELLHKSTKSYLKGVLSEDLLSHAEVVRLSTVIKAGLSLEEHKTRLKGGLGCDPSDEQLANSLRISRTELQSQLMACSLAREKLVMSNIRLVMSIAQKYDHVGANMPDLVQGGLIGLLCGIEKFDSSKGFKISTYVYWWIRQGITRAFAENSRTLRLPNYLHERLGLIRTAKIRLKEKGITPSIDRIADLVNMSPKQVRNATEAVSKIYSLDREPFPSLNGLPGDTYHSYIADKHPENSPWCAIDQWSLKEEVNNLINLTLREREREIVRLYYGLDNEYLTWDDISKRIGLSRERVRQVGLVALEKLKHAARKTKMKALLLKH